MEEEIIITKSELVKAYQLWNDEFKANPENFVSMEEATAEAQATNLIEYLKLVKN